MSTTQNRKRREKTNRMFAKTYNTFLPYVSYQTLSLTNNPEDAIEITQNIFLKIWRLIKRKLPTNNDLHYWFIITTKDEIRKYLRQKNQHQTHIKTLPHNNIQSQYPTHHTEDNPEKYLANKLNTNNINNIINSKLTKNQQETINLWQKSYTINEISNLTNKTTAQTRGYLQRAKHKLHTELSKQKRARIEKEVKEVEYPRSLPLKEGECKKIRQCTSHSIESVKNC